MIEVLQKSEASSTFKIEPENLRELCGIPEADTTSAKPTDDVCEVFLQVRNPSGSVVSYSLTLWNPDRPIHLVEGVQQ